MSTRNLSQEASIAVLNVKVEKLSEDVEALNTSIQQLIEVDRSLRLIIKAIKWIAGIISVLAGAWAAWRAP